MLAMMVILGTSQLQADETEMELKVAVLAFRGDAKAIDRWTSTMKYLSDTIPGYRFKALPYNLQDLDQVVIDGNIDFAITNAGQFVRLGTKYGLSWLATLKSRRHQGRGPVIGSALVVNSNSSAQNLEALKGQRLGAVDPLAFGGFQIYWGEMVNRGYQPKRFFSDIRFSNFPVDQLLQWLDNDEIDAVVLPACLLEAMAEEGKVDRNRYRILEQQQHANYGCQVSTQLYPNWSFSKLRKTTDKVAEKVAHALLTQPENSQASIDSGSLGWAAPVSSLDIHQLFQRLNIHPWQEPWWQVALQWLKLNWLWGALFFTLALLGFLHHLWVQILVNRRACEIEAINEELHHQQQELEHAQRVAILGELSSDLAHELKQPLAAINSYAEGGAVRIDKESDEHDLFSLLGRISTQAQRGAKIIERIRVFAKKGEINRQTTNLNTLIIETINLLDYEFKRYNVRPTLELPRVAIIAAVDPVEIQQLVVNLVRNSLDALQETVTPKLIITLAYSTEEDITLIVEDNGQGLGEHDPESLFKPFHSTKTNGLGLGMSICRRIVEAHEGRIQMEPAKTQGTRVICHFKGEQSE